MAGTSRDAKLTLSVEALGQEDITKLEKSLRDLAAQGGSSAAEFGALADQVGKLGDQNASLQSVKALSQAVQELTDKQRENTAASEAASAKLAEVKTATDTARTAQTAARDALTAGTQAYIEAGNALRALKAEYDASQRSTDEYRDKLKTLVDQQNKARVDLVGLREENRKTAQAVTEAAQAQRKAETEYKRTEAQVKRTDAALKEQGQALRDAGEAAAKLGVDVADLAAEEARLQTGFASVARSARERKAAMEEMAEATRLAEIESRSLVELQKRGEAALWAEEAAFRDAEKAVLQYQAAKAKAAADEIAWQKQADDIVSMRIAQEQATASTEQMIRSLRELEAQKAFAKKAEEAQQFVRAADYVRFWENALDEADRKEQELIANTNRLNEAFAAINVRAVEDVQREIDQANEAMKTLAASGRLTGGALDVAMRQGASRVEELQREIRALTGSLTTADKASSLLKNSLGQIAAGNIIADGVGYLVNKIKEMGVAALESVIQLDQLRRGLNAVYKDTRVAADQIEFLRKTATDSGVAVGSLQGEFVKFSASMNGANIPLQQSNELFAALSRAAATLGLDTEATTGALNALSQMAAKGTVSMEELRQQLGDRLPGALSLTAKGMGITEAQLIKLVESGQLATRDFVQPFTNALKGLQGATDGIIPTWNNFKNLLTLTAQNVGDAGGIEVLTLAIRTLSATVGGVGAALSGFITVIGTAARSLGVLAAAATTLTNPWEALKGLWSEAGERMGAVNESLGRAIGLTEGSSAANTELAASVAKVNAELEGAGNAAKIQALGLQLAGVATKDLSAALIQYNVESARLQGEQTKSIENSGKLAKAKKEEGDTLVRIAKLTGEEVAVRRQEAAAAAEYAQVMQQEALQRADLVTMLEEQIKFTEQNAVARNLDAKAVQDQLQPLREKLAAAKAEAEQSRQSAIAAANTRQQRELEVVTMGDQSAALAELRFSQAAAQQEYDRLLVLQKAGLASATAVADAYEVLAVVTYQVRDAEKDRIASMAQAAALAKSNSDLDMAALELRKATISAALQQAQADGKEYETKRLLIEQKKIEIEIVKATERAKIAEGEATIALLRVKREELDQGDPLLQQKQQAIDLSIKAAEADILRAKAAGQVVGELERELKALQNSNGARDQNNRSLEQERSSRGAVVSSTREQISALEELEMRYKLQADYSENQIALLEREAAAAERAAEAYRKKWNVDKEGYSLNTAGERVNMTMPSEAYIKQVAQAQGLTPQQTVQLIDEYFRNGRASGFNLAGTLNRNGESWFTVVAQAAEKLNTQNLRQEAGSGGTMNSPTTTGLTTETVTQNGTSKTVTINIGGSSRNVNVASQSDADNLVSVMRELERQSGTAA